MNGSYYKQVIASRLKSSLRECTDDSVHNRKLLKICAKKPTKNENVASNTGNEVNVDEILNLKREERTVRRV